MISRSPGTVKHYLLLLLASAGLFLLWDSLINRLLKVGGRPKEIGESRSRTVRLVNFFFGVLPCIQNLRPAWICLYRFMIPLYSWFHTDILNPPTFFSLHRELQRYVGNSFVGFMGWVTMKVAMVNLITSLAVNDGWECCILPILIRKSWTQGSVNRWVNCGTWCWVFFMLWGFLVVEILTMYVLRTLLHDGRDTSLYHPIHTLPSENKRCPQMCMHQHGMEPVFGRQRQRDIQGGRRRKKTGVGLLLLIT